MKILVISAKYPPDHTGGYEIRISEIVRELAKKSHEVRVISTLPIKRIQLNDAIHQFSVNRILWSNQRKTKVLDNMTKCRLTHLLGLILIFLRELLSDIHDLQLIDRAIKQFSPDVIYLGFILPLTRALLPFLADKKNPLVLDDGGATLIVIQEDKGLWYRFIDEISLLSKIKPLMVKFVYWVSSQRLKPYWSWPNNLSVLFKRDANYKAALERNIPLKHSLILHSGIDISQFSFRTRTQIKQPIIIVYPARVEPRKGQLDALKLISDLSREGVASKLFLIGDIRLEFLEEIKNEIQNLNIGDYVEIMPMIPHNELVNWYHQADFCFFPSYWKDGLSRVPLEAIACGAIIISYGNEGSSEIIQDKTNGFIIEEGNISMATKIIKGLISTPILVDNITKRARRDIETKYALGEYVDRIERFLKDVIDTD